MTAVARIEKPFTVPNLAHRWECSEGLIRKMIDRGELRSFRLGVLIRVPVEEVERIECQSLIASSDSTEGSGLSILSTESDGAESSMPKIARARKPRHAEYGLAVMTHRGRLAD